MGENWFIAISSCWSTTGSSTMPGRPRSRMLPDLLSKCWVKCPDPKNNQNSIDMLMGIINAQLGDDFTALDNEPTRVIVDRCVRLDWKMSRCKHQSRPALDSGVLRIKTYTSLFRNSNYSGSGITLKLRTGKTLPTHFQNSSSRVMPKRYLSIPLKSSSMTSPIVHRTTGKVRLNIWYSESKSSEGCKDAKKRKPNTTS